MIIRNIVACSTLLLVAFAAQSQNIEFLDKHGTVRVEILFTIFIDNNNVHLDFIQEKRRKVYKEGQNRIDLCGRAV